MKLYPVGTYNLGFRPIRLFVKTENSSGEVKLTPKDGGASTVTVGIDGPWGEAVSVLLHELYEAALIDLNTRYQPAPSYSEESSDFMFLVSHNQLSEVHERVGYLISKMLPDFSKTYKKYSPYKD